VAAHEEPREAGSLIALIGRPEYYQHGNVAVPGFLLLDRKRFPGFDGFLFLRKKDAELGFSNGVFVTFRPCAAVSAGAEGSGELADDVISRYSNKYVYVYGSFQRPARSVMNGHSIELGVICDIKSVVVRQMKKLEETKSGVPSQEEAGK
jgi:hypothetical protein